MNKEDIIRMARESGFRVNTTEAFFEELKRFAALVAFAERESLRESFRVVTAAEASAAILHEREACAKLCEDIYDCGPENGCCPTYWNEALDCATAAIRARGQA